jgi:hypothetical protein
MSDVRVESNASAVAADMRAAAQAILDTVAAVVAETDILFLEDLRGPQATGGSRPKVPAKGEPPAVSGVTPFRTGNLLNRGKTKTDGVKWRFTNKANPYSIRDRRISIDRGGESYASYAHKRNSPVGEYASDAEALFNKHFDDELEARAEAALMGVLDV